MQEYILPDTLLENTKKLMIHRQLLKNFKQTPIGQPYLH